MAQELHMYQLNVLNNGGKNVKSCNGTYFDRTFKSIVKF